MTGLRTLSRSIFSFSKPPSKNASSSSAYSQATAARGGLCLPGNKLTLWRQVNLSLMAKTKQAVLIVDMINDFQHEHGAQLFKQVLPVARKISRLKQRAKVADVPVIYVNDNFQHWHDTFQTTIEHVAKSS